MTEAWQSLKLYLGTLENLLLQWGRTQPSKWSIKSFIRGDGVMVISKTNPRVSSLVFWRQQELYCTGWVILGPMLKFNDTSGLFPFHLNNLEWLSSKLRPLVCVIKRNMVICIHNTLQAPLLTVVKIFWRKVPSFTMFLFLECKFLKRHKMPEMLNKFFSVTTAIKDINGDLIGSLQCKHFTIKNSKCKWTKICIAIPW